MLKWLYFVVVTAFLGAVVWMLNDLRLDAKDMVEKLDRRLDPILDDTEKAAKRINEQLPPLLKNSDMAARDINTHLPKLLAKGQQAVDRLDALAKSFRHFSDMFARRRASEGGPKRLAKAKERRSLLDGP
jgi:hypothetical protein